MQCIKIVYINTMMIFDINKYSIEGRGVCKRKKESGSVCKFMFPSIRLDDKTGWCKEIIGMLGNVKSWFCKYLYSQT